MTADRVSEKVGCSIRRALRADAAVLAELAEAIFVETFAADNKPEDMAAYVSVTYGEAQQRAEIESADNVVLLAEVDGTLAGYALIRRLPDAGNEIELSRFYIASPWHGRGVAQNLMREVEGAVRELGGSSIRLTVWERNFRAIAFYTKFGFRQVGTKPFILGSDVQTDLVMARELA